MIHIATAREILTAISNAPQSIGHHEIQSKTGIGFDEINEALDVLITAGYLKENRADTGTFFTRTPKRNAIMNFVTETRELEGVELDHDGRPEFWYADHKARYAVMILAYLRLQPEAAELNFTTGWVMPEDAFSYVTGYLQRTALIKEHGRKPGKFFTNPEYRDSINEFLETGNPSLLTGNTTATNAPSLAGHFLITLLGAPHACRPTIFMSDPLISQVTRELIEARIIRENENGFFTRRVMRPAIRTFTEGQYNETTYATLLATREPVTTPAPEATTEEPTGESMVIEILRALRAAPHAVLSETLPGSPLSRILALTTLRAKGVLKSNTDGWFTRRQHRAAVDQLLVDGDYPAFCRTVNAANRETEDSNEETEGITEEIFVSIPGCAQCVEDDNENLRELVRDMASVIGRMSRYI